MHIVNKQNNIFPHYFFCSLLTMKYATIIWVVLFILVWYFPVHSLPKLQIESNITSHVFFPYRPSRDHMPISIPYSLFFPFFFQYSILIFIFTYFFIHKEQPTSHFLSFIFNCLYFLRLFGNFASSRFGDAYCNRIIDWTFIFK